MFERFTEKAIKVILIAQEESRRMGHNFVGTEQLLLGIICEGTSIAAKAIKKYGVSLKVARVEVEKIIGLGQGFVAAEIPFTPRSKKVLELSWVAARDLKCNFISTEHLLLGLLNENGGVAVKVLTTMDVDLMQLKDDLLELNEGLSPSLLRADKVLSNCDSVFRAINVINDGLVNLHYEIEELCKSNEISKADAIVFFEELSEKLKSIEAKSKSVCVPEVFDFSHEQESIQNWIDTIK